MVSLKGFTLVEIIIVLVIISILAAVTIPSYNQHVLQSRRSEGLAALLNMMQQQERYFTEQLTYTDDPSLLGYTVNGSGEAASENSHYLITAEACASSTIFECVFLTAEPQGVQAQDGDLTLDSQGNKTPQASWK